MTAAQLAAANDEVSFAELGIGAKRAATEALEEELRGASAEAFADNFGATERPLRQEFDESMANLEAALGRVVTAWRAHASLIEHTYQAAARIHRASPRIRFPQYQQPSIDKTELRAIEVFRPVSAMVEKALGSLTGHR